MWPYKRNLELEKQIKELFRMASATQADIDALTAKSAAQDVKIKAVETAVAALVAANPGLDVSALQAALGTEDTDITALQGELPASSPEKPAA